MGSTLLSKVKYVQLYYTPSSSSSWIMGGSLCVISPFCISIISPWLICIVCPCYRITGPSVIISIIFSGFELGAAISDKTTMLLSWPPLAILMLIFLISCLVYLPMSAVESLNQNSVDCAHKSISRLLASTQGHIG